MFELQKAVHENNVLNRTKESWPSQSALEITISFVIMSKGGLFTAFLLGEIALSTFSFRIPFDLNHR